MRWGQESARIDETVADPVGHGGRLVRFDGRDFSGQVIDGLTIVDQTVRKARFDRATLRKAVFTRSIFVDCSFNGSNLEDADFSRALFENCDFRDAHLSGVNAAGAKFRGTHVLSYDGKAAPALSGPSLTFSGATIERSVFAGANLNKATLTNVRANDVDFKGADLRDSVFDACTISGGEFTGAKLMGADFSRCEEAESALPGWALSMVALTRRIDQADLARAIADHKAWLDSDGQQGKRLALRRMDLFEARLDGVNLSGCDIRGSRLDRASLRGARLVASDLRGASLIAADLRDADLREVLIDPETLARARLDGAKR